MTPRLSPVIALVALLATAAGGPVAAQTPTPSGPLPLSVEEAVALALARNYALRRAALDVERAEAQVAEARGALLPQIASTSSYTRNVATPSPFAGTSADEVFTQMGGTDFLLFNEQARTDGDPATQPITLEEFQRRQAEGVREAGGDPDATTAPSFNVPNQVRLGVSVEQTLYSRAARLGLEAAETVEASAAAGAVRQAQVTADSVRRAYYRALFAEARAVVFRRSAARAAETVSDAEALVEQGLASVYRRSSAQVELANTQAQLTQAENGAATAVDGLKLAVGIPPGADVRLVDELAVEAFELADVGLEEAVEAALARRADLRRVRLQAQLQDLRAEATEGQLYPAVSAFADLAYVGNVPDDRSRIASAGPSPFAFEEQERGFFSGAYWGPAVNFGVRVRWSAFDGGQLRARVRQDRVDAAQVALRAAELRDAVVAEVQRAVRDLESARERATAQAETVDLAEQNYDFVQRRVRVGLDDQLTLRDASDQLDEARLNYSQSVFDFLTARSRFEAAVGAPVVRPAREGALIRETAAPPDDPRP